MVGSKSNYNRAVGSCITKDAISIQDGWNKVTLNGEP